MNIYAVRCLHEMSAIDDETCSLAVHDAHECLDALTTLVLLAGERAMCWTHCDASSQSERSRGRPEAAAQAQRGPGVGGSL